MSKNHKPIDERELQQSDATAYALGELSAAEAAQFERTKAMNGESSSDAASEMEQARRLGQLLRSDISGEVAGVGSTSGESIRCSTQVREAVLAALDAQETNLPPKLAKPELIVVRRSRTRIWAWGLVASIAVAVGGFIIWSGQNEPTQTAQTSYFTSLVEQLTTRVEPGSAREIRVNAESQKRFGEAKTNESSLANSDVDLKSGMEFKGELNQDENIPGIPLQQSDGKLRARDRTEGGYFLESKVAPQVPAFGSPDNPFPQASAASPVRDPQARSNAVPDGGTILLGGLDRDHNAAGEELKLDRAGEGDIFGAAPESSRGEALDESEKSNLGSAAPPMTRNVSPESLSVRDRSTEDAAAEERPVDQLGRPSVEGLDDDTTRTGISYYNQMAPQGLGDGVNREIVNGREFAGGVGGGGFESQKRQDEKESYGYRYYSGRNRANEQYKSVPENPFWRPIGERAMSTFSVDVDTASYANVRRFLNEGSLPPPDAVRLEEFINYFHYDYPQPDEGTPFAVDLKLFGCPWNAQHSLLRVGLHGREIKAEKRPISNIVYLVDVSGSMSDENKLPLLKRGLAMMVDHLSENDSVSIVTYAGDAGVRLEPTNGANKKRILDAIDSLQSGGSTNGAAGIEIAYRLAQQQFVSEGANRVILMTDGDLNVGVTSDEALVTLIKEKAAGGVFLTVLGFGTGNLKDAKLEGLADNGNGIYGYIDSLGEAHKVLVEQMSGNLVTIAKDVKIQIEFNPAQVAGYRLIGYENRVMANQDFANDRKDAGEIGAGHTVTALYEIVPVGAMLGVIDPSSPTLKYQTLDSAPRDGDKNPKAEARLTEAAASGELAQVALRFKTPEGTESRLIEFTAKAEVTSFSQADSDCRFAAAVAGFGMRLRQSPYAGNITLDAIAEIASAAAGNDPNGHRAEFVDLVRRAKSLQHNAGE